ncbi:hypothetical protein OUZ56_002692 [Daphnia magna]|uniref:Uncharacterized protein n=1 Tax=Daphnia magna TaxID=35525 RepID=A0ABR0A6H4_9CRUS|nr:hypothetical protein OUZ56_002692 [Daphnia magna]
MARCFSMDGGEGLSFSGGPLEWHCNARTTSVAGQLGAEVVIPCDCETWVAPRREKKQLLDILIVLMPSLVDCCHTTRRIMHVSHVK